MAQQLHQQPGRIAAGTGTELERFVRRLHAGLHADQIADVLVHHLVDRHQKIDGAALAPVDAGQAGLDAFGQVLGGQVGCQFLLEQRFVVERIFLGAGLQKEVKRVVHRHLHHQIDRDLELARLLLKDQAALVVGKRILLPVDEVLRRFHLERIGNDLAAAMGCRA